MSTYKPDLSVHLFTPYQQTIQLFISTGDLTDRRPVAAPVSGRTGCHHAPAERSAAAVTGLRHAEPVVMRRCGNPVIRLISSTEAMHVHMQPTRTCVRFFSEDGGPEKDRFLKAT